MKQLFIFHNDESASRFLNALLAIQGKKSRETIGNKVEVNYEDALLFGLAEQIYNYLSMNE